MSERLETAPESILRTQIAPTTILTSTQSNDPVWESVDMLNLRGILSSNYHQPKLMEENSQPLFEQFSLIAQRQQNQRKGNNLDLNLTPRI